MALIVALAALAAARRAPRRLEALNQANRELRYDYTRLRSQVARLDPEPAPEDPTQEDPAATPAPSPAVSFVPLSSMKKKS